jgi:hypothetical protein
VAFRHICRFIAASGVGFFSFITLSGSLSHFISGLPLHFLPSGDQVSICIGYRLLPLHNRLYVHKPFELAVFSYF